MLRALVLGLLVVGSLEAAAQRKVESSGFSYLVDKPPAWVQPAPTATVQSSGRAAVRYHLVDTQVNLAGPAPARFHRIRLSASDPSGLSEAAELRLQFNPAYESIVFHELGVTRQGKRFNKLGNFKLDLLQRETQLERSVYDGVVTAFAVLDDVRVGDVVDFSYTVHGHNPVFEDRFSDEYVLNFTQPIDLRRVRIEHPKSRPLLHRLVGTNHPVAKGERGANSIVEITLAGLSPVVVEDRLPYWVRPFPEMQVSEYSEWKQVDEWARAHFTVPKQLSPELQALAARFRSESKSQEELAARVLQFVQDEIRYFAVATGTNSHKPRPADETFQRRYGDCKDKTVLAVVLLQHLGIDARPALVSAYRRQQVAEMLPSPLAFDHVIVHASIDGKAYWLDATRTLQGGLALNRRGFEPFGKALIVGGEGELVDMRQPDGYDESLTVTERHSVQRFSDPVQLKIVARSRGAQAERMRAYLANKSSEVVRQELVDDVVRRYPGAKPVEALQVMDDRDANEFSMVETYELPQAFTYEDGFAKTDFFASGMSSLLRMPEKVNRTLPLALPYPYSQAHRAEYEVPLETRLVTAQPVSISSPHLAFDYRSNFGNRVMAMQYSVRFLRDYVTASELPGYLEHLGRMRELFSRSLRFPLFNPETLRREYAAAVKERRAEWLREPSWMQRYLGGSLARRMRGEAAIASGLLEGTMLAQAWRDVGVEYSGTGDRAKALEAIDRALVADPGLKAAHLARAELLAYTGRFDEALEAVQRAGDASGAPFTHAQIAYYLGRHKDALDLLSSEVARTSGAAQSHRLLWTFLAARRAGIDPANLLKEKASMARQSEWPGPIISYLLGEIDEDSMLGAARENEREAPAQLCEAWFFTGQKRLLSGDREGARQAFEKAIATRIRPYVEYSYSEIELARLR